MNDSKELTTSASAESDTLLTLKSPYTFEEKTYTEFDLSGMDSLTAGDMIAAEKYLNRAGLFSPIPEMTVEYVCFIASRATKLPIELFRGLPPREAVRLKNKVTGFFYGTD